MGLLSKNKARYSALPLWMRATIRISVIGLLLVVFLIATQSIQIFPGAFMSLIGSDAKRKALPERVTSVFVETEDSESLEAWRLAVDGSKQVAIIFHGNAGDVQNFFAYQKYLESVGIRSYGFDYRGFGKSTGWPSEQGVYYDADAMVEYVLKTENISPAELVIVGISIGTGPATYAAKKYSPGALVLFSPFVSLTEVVKQRPLLGYLHSFLFFEFPARENVKALDSTCLFVAHGKKDNIIPFSQGKSVFEAYRSQRHSAFIASEEASHNDILFKTHQQLSPELKNCFKAGS